MRPREGDRATRLCSDHCGTCAVDRSGGWSVQFVLFGRSFAICRCRYRRGQLIGGQFIGGDSGHTVSFDRRSGHPTATREHAREAGSWDPQAQLSPVVSVRRVPGRCARWLHSRHGRWVARARSSSDSKRTKSNSHTNIVNISHIKNKSASQRFYPVRSIVRGQPATAAISRTARPSACLRRFHALPHRPSRCALCVVRCPRPLDVQSTVFTEPLRGGISCPPWHSRRAAAAAQTSRRAPGAASPSCRQPSARLQGRRT